jgi:hypothetical protein
MFFTQAVYVCIRFWQKKPTSQAIRKGGWFSTIKLFTNYSTFTTLMVAFLFSVFTLKKYIPLAKSSTSNSS